MKTESDCDAGLIVYHYPNTVNISNKLFLGSSRKGKADVQFKYLKAVARKDYVDCLVLDNAGAEKGCFQICTK